MRETLRVGTRGSLLALAQARLAQSALSSLVESIWGKDIPIELCEIRTTGDSRQGTRDASIPDKQMWIRELEDALLCSNLDLAVHSGKDVPTEISPRTKLLPILERDFPEDVFVHHLFANNPHCDKNSAPLQDLPKGARIGTASARRRAELLRHRSDLQIVELRGNVNTRLRKLTEKSMGGADLMGIIVARAGLERLGISIPCQILPSSLMLPAVNQGILVAQYRAEDKHLERLLEKLVKPEVFATWQAERECIRILGADCHSAVAVYGEVRKSNSSNSNCQDSFTDRELKLTARVLNADGSQHIESVLLGACSQSLELGQSLAELLISRGADKLL